MDVVCSVNLYVAITHFFMTLLFLWNWNRVGN